MDFADTGWEANPSLAEKIGFPSTLSKVDEVAKNESIDREALHYFIGFLKKNSNITLTQIQELLHKKSEASNDGSSTGPIVSEPGAKASKDKPTDFPSRPRPPIPPNPTGGGSRTDRIPNKSGEQISITTLRTSPDGSSGDRPGDGNQRNREVEDAAIKLILTEEPFLRRTEYGNHGFDLWKPGPNDNPVRWIEVKSSAGEPSSVSLSITQFRFALKKQDAYWLYVVINVTLEGTGNILKIQNPAKWILNTIDGFNLSLAWIEQHQSRENTEEG